MDKLPIYLSNPNDLVTLPDVYFRVRDLVHQGAGTHEISQVVSLDPALTVRFLSIANSALFSPNTEIGTVSRAVTLLGTQLVHDIVLASSVSDLFDGIPKEVIDVRSFWAKSVTCGAIAKSLAEQLQMVDSGHVFVQGLLAEIGHVVMYQYESENMIEIMSLAKALGAKTYKIEREKLGYDYCDVGGYLAEQWDLPAGIPETTLYHQEPATTDEFRFEASIVHIAHRLCEFKSQQVIDPDFDPVALQSIRLSEQEVMGVYEDISAEIDIVISSFSGVKAAA